MVGKRAGAVALLVIASMLVTTAPLALRSTAAPSTLRTATGSPVDPAIAAIWRSIDGPVADQTAGRAWTWGPTALAATVEYSGDSPNGVRRMTYFDKGRLDILDGAASPDSEWYVTGALLVAQMLAGQVPFDTEGVVSRPSPQIAVAGDFDQPAPLTYAALAPLASIEGHPIGNEEIQGDIPEDRTGQPVVALLAPDGTVTADGADPGGVIVSSYDAVTGHNVASPFSEWAARQPVSALWLTGRPLTEPYWLDTVVGGVDTRVLIQAFERRILTYSPGLPAGWQVESNNAGAHYRLWRGLYQPVSSELYPLANGEPFGEEIVGAAVEHGVDPFLLAAIARAASGGYPLASQDTGGVGLLAVRPEVASELGGGDLHDPRLNALLGATELSRWSAGSDDIRAVLTGYFAGSRTDVEPTALVDATLTARDDLIASYSDVDEPAPPVADNPSNAIDSGAAAYYSPSYDRAWWERTMSRYASYGLVAAGWQVDPNGYYCVHPGFIPGQRLHLVANGVELDCTIGDTVAAGDIASWNAHWAIELNWEAFVALGLDHHNQVDVYLIGPVG